MSDPLVTVILTVFRRTDYLEEAILSVLRQTFASFEVLVTDDANQGTTRAICDKFSSDGRVRYRANSTTLGTPLNIAAALHESRGQYVTILNDDDLMEPEMLDRLVHPLEQFADVVLAFGNHAVIDGCGRHLTIESRNFMRERRRDGLKTGVIGESFEFAVRRNLMVVMGCVFRRSACDPDWLVSEVAGAYDYWLVVKLATQGLFYFVPENMMSWRCHVDSVTAKPSPDKFRSEVFIYDSLNKLPLAPELRQYVHAQLTFFLYLRGYEFLLHGLNRRDAQAALRRALKLHPSARLFVAWGLTFMPTSLRRIAIRTWQRTLPLRNNAKLPWER